MDTSSQDPTDAIFVPSASIRYRIVNRDLSPVDYLDVGLRSARHLIPIIEKYVAAPHATLLDFGCGCARILQFLKLAKPNWSLYGCDIDAEMIDWDKSHIANSVFDRNGAHPPLPYPSKYFDVILALSVFTHFNEDMQFEWLSELARITKPGGIVYFTIHGRQLWNEQFSKQFNADTQAKFDSKGFVYIRNIGDGILPDWYQTSFQTIDYLKATAPRSMKIIEHVPKGHLNWQDSILVRVDDLELLP